MTIIEIIGFISAALIGLSLGLIGGGGSILTVPVLVYLIGVDPILATAYSLFIVGVSALIGGINYARKGLVDFKTGIVFTIPAFAAVYLTRLLIVPALPEFWFTIGSLEITRSIGIMVLFAILMIAASFSMISNKKKELKEDAKDKSKHIKFNYPLIIIEGAVVGTLTGLVGAGGGFLIIPALVVLAKLNMKEAIGTSLLIIAVKSLLGFIGDVQAGTSIDWTFLIIFSSIAVAGIFIGTYFSAKIKADALKKGFGYFVLIMGSSMVVKELFF